MNRASDRDARIVSLERELALAREREQDLVELIDNASLGLHWINAEGTILRANRALLEMLGYSHGEYVGHNIAEFHAGAGAALDILELLHRQQTPPNYEARLRAKDGAIRYVSIACDARWNHDELVHARCLVRDITDRGRYQQRLLVENGAARILSGSASLEAAAPALLELIGGQFHYRTALLWMPREDQNTLHCAASWEAPPGDTCGFAAMSRRFALFANADLPGRIWRDKAPEWVADLEQDGRFPRLQCALQFGLRSAFGFPLMAGVEVCGVMEFLADDVRPPDRDLLETTTSLAHRIGEFLERTRAQQRLAEVEKSYRVLTETASDGILTIKADGTVLFANAAAAKMFGYASQELTGSAVRLLIPERLRNVQNQAAARYLNAPQPIGPLHSIPFSGLHRHGHEIPMEISIGEYRQGNRQVFVAVLRDITERKSLDETLRQTAKLESLGVLAGGIAHDFNNLLTGILGNVSVSIEMLEPDHPVSLFLREACDASERAAHLTRQLLAYAGKGRFVVEPIDISALVREMSNLVKGFIPEHVTLRLDLEETLPPVEADTAQIQQLVMNLVINAAEAIPKDRRGTVLVTTRFQEVDARYVEQMLGKAVIAPGPYLVINVHDNGAGMDEETLGKIFDPFFTTKFTGRGLGLAAAVGIVRGHKGALKVFSDPGQGTTFKVLLPAATASQPELIAAEGGLSLSGAGSVLVVDDEPVVRKAAASSLEYYGYSVVTAEDGREAVERFRELHHQLAAVILDMTMPVMSGEESLRQMRLIDPGVPVILSSGYNEVEAIRRFAGKGLAGFLQKPYTAKALAEKIRLTLNVARRQ